MLDLHTWLQAQRASPGSECPGALAPGRRLNRSRRTPKGLPTVFPSSSDLLFTSSVRGGMNGSIHPSLVPRSVTLKARCIAEISASEQKEACTEYICPCCQVL